MCEPWFGFSCRSVRWIMIVVLCALAPSVSLADDCNFNGILDETEVLPEFTQQIINSFGIDMTIAVASDIDGDGDLDVIAAAGNDRKVYRFYNLGAGVLTPQDEIASGFLSITGLRSGDIDGDDDIDFVVSDGTRQEILLYENDGQGTFSAGQIISSGNGNVRFLHLADIDGDTDLDVLETSGNADSLVWTENTGGTFGTRHTISNTLSSAFGVYAADIDSDNDLDVIVASQDDDMTLWYENLDGLGTFGPAQIVSSVADGPRTMVAADLDGDADLDIVLGSQADNTLAWIENTDGLGSFGPRQIISITQFGLSAVGAADLNEDGMIDIIVSATAGDEYSWFQNLDNAGSFSSAHHIARPTGQNYFVEVADINQDGHPDVLIPRDQNSRLAWYRNENHDCNGNGIPDDCDLAGNDCNSNTIPDDCESSADCNNNLVSDICELSNNDCNNNLVPDTCELPGNDCNADGIPDDCQQDCNGNGIPEDCEALDDCNGNGIQDSCDALSSDCDGNGVPDDCDPDCDGDGTPDRCDIRPTFEEVLVSPSASNPQRVRSGDLDGDGDQDVIIGASTQTKIYWRKNNGSGGFGGKTNITVLTQGVTDVQLADLDGDNDLDVVSTSHNDFKLAWYENTDGEGNFSSQRIIDILDRPQAAFAADLDGDLDLDILAATSTDDEILWYENTDGEGTFGPKRIITTSANYATCVIAGDFDGDGDNDVAYTSQSDNTVAWRENLDGSGDFSGPERQLSVDAMGARVIAAADLDGDGDLDIVAGSQLDNRIMWYRNQDGLGDFSAPILLSDSFSVWAIELADLDNDGDVDITAASLSDSRVYWMENLDGSGSFASDRIISNSANGPRGIAVADVNGDGRRDIHVVSTGDNSQRWYRNQSTDCDGNLVPDECEISGNDCDDDGIIDPCETDCNENGLPDDCETSPDCNSNGILDACEPDCDGDGIPDECELVSGDCNVNGVPDDCETDCDNDGVPDECELSGNDCDANGVPDDCQADCDNDGYPDVCAVIGNDCNGNGIPDDCEPDCDNNGITDECELAGNDCNGNGIPDVCEPFSDCNGNGIADFCDADVAFSNSTILQAPASSVGPLLDDLDGDGDLDMLISDYSQEEYVWRENLDGQAQFGQRQLIAGNINGVEIMATGDLDGDGDLDIITISAFDDTVVWHENADGAGTLSGPTIVTTFPNTPRQAATDDVDKDGDLDIVLAVRHGNRLVWYENLDGQGNFGPENAISFSISIPSFMGLVDIDGDGDRDMVIVSSTSEDIAWYEHINSAPYFVSESYIDTNLEFPGDTRFADIDGDGDMDVVATSTNTDQIFWYENSDGLGTFQSRQIIDNTVNAPARMIAVDLDNDGDIDIVSSSGQPNSIAWHRNSGGGVFAAPEVVFDGLTSTSRPLVPSDMDNDGDIDIIVPPASDAPDYLLLTNTRDDCNNNHVPDACEISGNDCNANGVPDDCDVDCNGNGIPDACEMIVDDCNANGIPDECESAEDCDSNGIADICDIAAGANDCNNNLVPDACEPSANDCNANGIPDDCESDEDCNGNGVRDLCESAANDCNANGILDPCETDVDFVSHSLSQVISSPTDIRLADIDGDGDLDVVSSGGPQHAIVWNENLDGAGSFGPVRPLTGNIEWQIADLAIADMDGDGDVDVTVVATSPNLLLWFENTDGLGSFSGPNAIGSLLLPDSIAIVDVDNDGFNDVIVSSREPGATLAWFRNVGTAGQQFGPRQTILSENNSGDVAAADFDGDGDIDVFSERIGGLIWHRNLDGLGTFSGPLSVNVDPDDIDDLYVGDMDGDGDQDIYFLAPNDNEIGWIENSDGAGTFGPRRVITSDADDPFEVDAADLDGDGDLDIVATASDDDVIMWIENLGTGAGFDVRRIIRSDANNARGIRAGDIDNDGDFDFVAAWSPINTVAWFENTSNDCNGNGRPDACDLPLEDCNANGIIDSCEHPTDCNNNSVPDFCELSGNDCNANGIPDECEPMGDCNANSIQDICELFDNDCNGNMIPDACESSNDCNANGILDFCELDDNDCNANGVPDDCETDCDANGVIDDCQTEVVFSTTLLAETSLSIERLAAGDLDGDGFPDVVISSDTDQAVLWYPNLTDGTLALPEEIDVFAQSTLTLRIIDVDADGDNDVVTTSASDNSIGWYENLDGIGTFGTRVVIADGSFGSPILDFADIDSDGDQDIVVVSTLPGNYIVWLPNNGGTVPAFGAPLTVDFTAPNIIDLAVIDVDLDGRLDVVALTVSSSDVVWFRNYSGIGDFEVHRPIIDDSENISAIELADIDADGIKDLIAVSTAQDRTQWLRVVGGTNPFAAPVEIVEELTAIDSISAADVNGDGMIDLVMQSTANTTSAWFENLDGAGGFAPPKSIAANGMLISVDIDHDANMDFLHADAGGSEIRWLRNLANDCNGNQVPDTCEDLIEDCDQNGVPDACEVPGNDCDNNGIPNNCELSGNDCNGNSIPDTCESPADCDGNGIPDICDIAAGSIDCDNNNIPDVCELSGADTNANGILDVCELEGGDCNLNGRSDLLDTEPQFVARLVDASIDAPFHALVADFNGDNWPDILATSVATPKVAWYPNVGGIDQFGAAIEIASTLSLDATALLAVDFDSDGDIDIVVGYQAAPTDDRIVLYENRNGLGEFSAGKTISRRATNVSSLAAADLDEDGDLDIVAGLQDRIAWYENTDGGFAPEQLISMNANWIGRIALADLDGDDDIDVVSAEIFGVLAWHENLDALGTFGPRQLVATGNPKTDVVLVDLDQDGDIDIVNATSNMPNIEWYENLDGAGSFGERNIVENGGGEILGIDIVDLDADGDLDILAASFEGDTISWYENLDGMQTFAPQSVIPSPATEPREIRAADFDGDGDLDLMSVSTGDNRLIWYDNLGNDCNGNAIPDSCELAGNDCNTNGAPDDCEPAADCDGNGIQDICDIANGAADCNGNNVLDTCELAEHDCDFSGVVDICEIIQGVANDCNVNGHPDTCDVVLLDCNNNGLVDSCETVDGPALDCNNNAVPDACEMSGNDCNESGIPDDCELIDNDCNTNGIPDECELDGNDCNFNGVPDDCDAETIFARTQIAQQEPSQATGMAAADLDEDGDQDLAVAYYRANQILWLENADGFDSVATSMLIDDLCLETSDVATADINGDSHIDIVAACPGNPAIYWYENQGGTGEFGVRQLISDRAGSPDVLALGDIDGDDDMDVACFYRQGERVEWFENTDGLGTFGSANSVDMNLHQNDALYLVDLDGDGDLDLIDYTGLNDDIYWYENLDGLGIYSGRIAIEQSLPNGAEALDVGDVDGDGDVDVIVGISNGDILWYRNLNAGDFEFVETVDSNVSSLAVLALIDVDADGDKDVVAGSDFFEDLYWLENVDGNGGFAPGQHFGNTNGPPIKIVGVDLNGDGAPVTFVSSEKIVLGSIYRFESRLRGDIDGDGVICIDDVGRMVQALLGTPEDPEDLIRADQDLNGVADARDLGVLVDALIGN